MGPFALAILVQILYLTFSGQPPLDLVTHQVRYSQGMISDAHAVIRTTAARTDLLAGQHARQPAPPARTPSPGESKLVFRSYKVAMNPTEGAVKLGAAPREDLLHLRGGGIHSSRYVGGGCVSGPYSRVVVERVEVGDAETTFRVKAETAEKESRTAEWSGRIRGEKIEGEVSFTGTGSAIPAPEIDRAVQSLWDEQYKSQLIFFKGRVQAVNKAQIEAEFEAESSALREQLCFRGNVVKYRFAGSLASIGVESPPTGRAPGRIQPRP